MKMKVVVYSVLKDIRTVKISVLNVVEKKIEDLIMIINVYCVMQIYFYEWGLLSMYWQLP